MALPILTPDQRSAAAAAATRARAARADVCTKLKSGELSLPDVLAIASFDQAVAKLRVSSLLQAMPGIGQAKAATLMDRLGIAQSRRLRGLGQHQAAALRREFDGQ